MSDPKLDPETNITPPTNDAAVKENGDAAPAPEKSEDVKPEAKDTEMSEGVKEEDVKDEKKDEKKPKSYDNGILKTTRRADESGDFKKNSKYDPSVLPETDNAAEIRKQVWSYDFLRYFTTLTQLKRSSSILATRICQLTSSCWTSRMELQTCQSQLRISVNLDA
jgi:hypothetical protein